MKSLGLRVEPHIPISSSNPPVCVKPIKLVVVSSYGKNLKHPPSKFAITLREHTTTEHTPRLPLLKPENGHTHSRIVIMGAVCVGILAVVLSEQKALALGPEGPLVEEFWDNVRRYGLYALTVSTGALYTIFRPIVDLLKNPISAIFILALFGGSIYIVSQVLSAMVGVSDFLTIMDTRLAPIISIILYVMQNKPLYTFSSYYYCLLHAS
ncbi:Ycf33 family protein [Spatholobus suberectus]|nr:Ycf33 family protein [Spatholobus suberectus]